MEFLFGVWLTIATDVPCMRLAHIPRKFLENFKRWGDEGEAMMRIKWRLIERMIFGRTVSINKLTRRLFGGWVLVGARHPDRSPEFAEWVLRTTTNWTSWRGSEASRCSATAERPAGCCSATEGRSPVVPAAAVGCRPPSWTTAAAATGWWSRCGWSPSARSAGCRSAGSTIRCRPGSSSWSGRSWGARSISRSDPARFDSPRRRTRPRRRPCTSPQIGCRSAWRDRCSRRSRSRGSTADRVRCCRHCSSAHCCPSRSNWRRPARTRSGRYWSDRSGWWTLPGRCYRPCRFRWSCSRSGRAARPCGSSRSGERRRSWWWSPGCIGYSWTASWWSCCCTWFAGAVAEAGWIWSPHGNTGSWSPGCSARRRREVWDACSMRRAACWSPPDWTEEDCPGCSRRTDLAGSAVRRRSMRSGRPNSPPNRRSSVASKRVFRSSSASCASCARVVRSWPWSGGRGRITVSYSVNRLR